MVKFNCYSAYYRLRGFLRYGSGPLNRVTNLVIFSRSGLYYLSCCYRRDPPYRMQRDAVMVMRMR